MAEPLIESPQEMVLQHILSFVSQYADPAQAAEALRQHAAPGKLMGALVRASQLGLAYIVQHQGGQQHLIRKFLSVQGNMAAYFGDDVPALGRFLSENQSAAAALPGWLRMSSLPVNEFVQECAMVIGTTRDPLDHETLFTDLVSPASVTEVPQALVNLASRSTYTGNTQQRL